MRRSTTNYKGAFDNTFAYVIIILLCVALALVVYLHASELNRQEAEQAAQLQAQLDAMAAPEPTPEPTPEPVRNTKSLQISFLGDFVCQSRLLSESRHTEITDIGKETESTEVSYDFSALLSGLSGLYDASAYTDCTLVGVLQDADELTDYRAPALLARALAETGLDAVNAANEKILAFNGTEGLVSTAETLSGAGLAALGISATEEEFAETGGIVYRQLDGVKIAFLSYTVNTDDISAADYPWCVNILVSDYMSTRATVDTERVEADLAAARAAGADLIVCHVYWGENYRYYTTVNSNSGQREMAQYLCDAGVDVLIGSGVKTPEPIEIYQTQRDGQSANAVIAYSLGNLACSYSDLYTNLSACLQLEIFWDIDRGGAWIGSVSYNPVYLLNTGLYDELAAVEGQFRILDPVAELIAYEDGAASELITASVAADMTTGIESLRTILGADFEQTTGGVTLEAPAVAQ